MPPDSETILLITTSNDEAIVEIYFKREVDATVAEMALKQATNIAKLEVIRETST